MLWSRNTLFGILAIVVFAGTASAQQRANNNVCKKPTGLFPHEDYCDYYYDCEDGQATVQTCPNGLAFAGKTKGLVANCDYPHKVNCPDEEGRTMGQSPISSPNCHWQYGIFAHATSCTRYWQCWNGTATAQQCPFSLLFNDVMHACDWPDNVPDCQKHPICKDVANGPIPIEKSCGRYWLCVGGYPRLQRCPAGLAFNQETSKCELAETVEGCEPEATTENPEEENEAPPPPRQNQQSRPQSQSRPQTQSRPQQQAPPRAQPPPSRPPTVPIQQIIQQQPVQQRARPQTPAPVQESAFDEDDYEDVTQPPARPQQFRPRPAAGGQLRPQTFG